MCGRFALDLSWSEILSEYLAQDDPVAPGELGLRSGVFPGQIVGLIRLEEGRRVARHALWNFTPSWSRTPPAANRPLINARAETAAAKPTFRTAMRRGRCVVPATSFHEWQATHEGKIPHIVTPADGPTFALAAIMEVWRGPGDDFIPTLAILTTSPNASLRDIHDRMPVIIPRTALDRWLDPATPPSGVEALLVPAPDRSIRVSSPD